MKVRIENSFPLSKIILGYVDMTVEYGKLEYNFSFFYYNPEMCDPEDDCMPEDTI